MTGRLDGQVALVTGGSSGIGRASALALAREGAKVAVADVAVEGGEATKASIRAAGGEAIFIRADVADSTQVAALIEQVIEAYGRLDCAHNNAGIEGVPYVVTADYPEETWDRVIAVNLRGIWLCMKHEIPQMLKNGGGVIVNTASVLGLTATKGSSAYVASKHAVVGLTKTAAAEYASAGIRVNAVCPGFIDTPMVERAIPEPQTRRRLASSEPMGRMGTPEEVAEAVVWLCSDAASFVTGHTMVVDGGRLAQ